MKDNFYLLIDLDNTVLDCSGPLWEHTRNRLGREPNSGPFETYSVAEAFDIPTEVEREIVGEFIASPCFFKMKMSDDAKAAMRYFKNEGAKIIAITSAQNDEKTKIGRMENFKREAGFDLDDIHLTLGKSKKEALSAYPPSIFVDDLPENCEVAHGVGHISLLIGHGYNSNFSGSYRRVSGWAEIIEHVLPHIYGKPETPELV